MQANYQCVKCDKTVRMAPTSAVICRACGCLYLRWLNYGEWVVARGKGRSRPAETRKDALRRRTAG